MNKLLLFFSLLPLGCLSQIQLSENVLNLEFPLNFNSQEIPLIETNIPGNLNTPAIENNTIDPLLAEELENVLVAAMAGYETKGISVAISFPEGEIWTGTIGNSEESPNDTLELSPEMRFGIGGITKTFTAACVLQLYEEGLLQLDDSLFQWLPTYPNVNPEITIRQLLKHTSGVFEFASHPDFFPVVNMNPNQFISPDEILNSFVAEPYFPPGVNVAVSNTNYILLGKIIEAVTGNAYHEEIRSRFLEPYDLNSVNLFAYEDFTGPQAHMWINSSPTEVIDAQANGVTFEALFSASWSSIGYFGTPEDMAKWARLLFAEDVLNTETYYEMTNPVNLGNGFAIGMGTYMFNYFGNNGIGHIGDIVYSSSLFYFLEKDLSIAVFDNDNRVTANDMLSISILLLQTYCDYLMTTPTEQFETEKFNFKVFPNPSNNFVHFQYLLKDNAKVSLKIYNNIGQEIVSLPEVLKPRGTHHFEWDVDRLPSGIYSCHLNINGLNTTCKLIIY